MATVVLTAGLFVFVAHLLELLFEKTRIPDILLLMLLGLVAGPVMGLISQEDLGRVGEFLSTLTLLVILFESGLSLKLKSLFESAGRAAPFAIISMGLAIACITGVMKVMLGLDTWMAILGGFILGGTSSAVVIPMLKALKGSESTMTMLTLESTVTDVFCIIGTVGIAASLAAGEKVQAQVLLGNATFSLVVASFLGILFAVVWSVGLTFATRLNDNLFTTLAGAMVVYGLSERLEISGAIATLCFGIALGNLPRGVVLTIDRAGTSDPLKLGLREVGAQEKRVYAETVFLLKAAFFFYLGMQVAPAALFSKQGFFALVLALVPFFPRYPVVRLFFSAEETSRREALLASVLVPRGLAAAVLAMIPVNLGLQGGEALASLVAMTVFWSIASVSVMVLLVERGKLDSVGALAFGSFSHPEQPDGNVPSAEKPVQTRSAVADRPPEAVPGQGERVVAAGAEE